MLSRPGTWCGASCRPAGRRRLPRWRATRWSSPPWCCGRTAIGSPPPRSAWAQTTGGAPGRPRPWPSLQRGDPPGGRGRRGQRRGVGLLVAPGRSVRPLGRPVVGRSGARAGAAGRVRLGGRRRAALPVGGESTSYANGPSAEVLDDGAVAPLPDVQRPSNAAAYWNRPRSLGSYAASGRAWKSSPQAGSGAAIPSVLAGTNPNRL
jgi:hypothetical protein